MHVGDILHFKVSHGWDLYYEIIKINKKSLSILCPESVKPERARTIHKVTATSNFSSASPMFTINGVKHQVYLKRHHKPCGECVE